MGKRVGNEGGIYREKESRKKNGEMRSTRARGAGAHLAFIVLYFRENIFLIFEEFSGKGRRRGRSDQRRKKENVEAKGDIERWKKRRAIQGREK